MDLNKRRKKYVKIYRETRSDEIFGLLDEVNSDLEDDIDNLKMQSRKLYNNKYMIVST